MWPLFDAIDRQVYVFLFCRFFPLFLLVPLDTGLVFGLVFGWVPFQYLMKAELLWLPVVGWKAVLARDIFVHRGTSTTFRQLLRSTTRSLKSGNSIMTFPGMFGLFVVGFCLGSFPYK